MTEILLGSILMDEAEELHVLQAHQREAARSARGSKVEREGRERLRPQ